MRYAAADAVSDAHADAYDDADVYPDADDIYAVATADAADAYASDPEEEEEL